ncbi:MAG: OmpA family protein [Myxococcota bacterium]
MRRPALLAGAFALAQLVSVQVSSAQSAQGFALDRFEPSERGHDWFVTDSLDFRGNFRPSFGGLVEWSHNPLVIYSDGEPVGAIVRDQWVTHVYGSLTYLGRLRFSLDLPALLGQGGDAATIQGDRFDASNGIALGDLRAGVSVRLLGQYASPFSLAAGLQGHLPTGKQAAFFGNGSVSIVPRVMVAGQLSSFVYAAQVGLRAGEQRLGWLNETTGEALMIAASVGLRPLPELTIGPELWSSSEIGKNRFLARTATPVEVLMGSHFQAGELNLGAGIGCGLGRGYGSPEVRAVVSLAWAPLPTEEPKPQAPPITDRDHDGILDNEDACVDSPGPATSDPKTNGCPPPPDGDRDGIFDSDDACPNEAGIATRDPATNGCPAPKDRDADGILDQDDACPDEPGVASADPKTNGCPAPKDRDGDGVFDVEDACPDAPGPRSEQTEKNGCPLARVESTQIVILEAVRFAYNSDVILPASEPVLRAVLNVVDTHPEIGGLEVHGHTDDKGGANYNLQLSKRRAAAVANWLIKHGLAKSRIASFGFGKTRPLVLNDNDQNRQRNRRVEFHIIPKSD